MVDDGDGVVDIDAEEDATDACRRHRSSARAGEAMLIMLYLVLSVGIRV